MPRAYLIAGAPRVGKTILANKLVAEKPMFSISTDAIRYMLRRTVPKTQDNQALFEIFDSVRNVPTEMALKYLANTNRFSTEQIAESRIVWEAVKQVIHSNIEDGLDIAVEGVAVLP